MTIVNDAKITIVMAVQNEAKYINFLENILELDQGEIFEVLVINDRSTDDTFEKCQLLVNKYKNIKLFQNDSDQTVNQMILFLLNKVETKFVHIRTPHDFYCNNFYKFHLKRLTEHPNAVLSSNHTKNTYELPEFKFNRPNLNLLFTRIYNRILDHSISSCGFIVETETIKLVWQKYILFEKHADWFAKKEICLFYETIHSFNILSYYNLNKSRAIKIYGEAKSLQQTILEKVHENFWVLNNRQYIAYPEHEISISNAYLYLKPKTQNALWHFTFSVSCFRYIIKKLFRRFRTL